MKFSLFTIATVASTASAFSTTSSFTSGPVASVASDSALNMKYKVAVVGGGPSGACAAEIFAQEKGIDTVLFERKLDNAKPCGGAIPLCMVGEFDMPETVVDRKVGFESSLLMLIEWLTLQRRGQQTGRMQTCLSGRPFTPAVIVHHARLYNSFASKFPSN